MASTPAEIMKQADDALPAVLASIQLQQDAYGAANRDAKDRPKTWQGLKLFSAPPADGTAVKPDIGTKTPSDLAGSPWPAAIRAANLPMSLEVHRYQTPRDGWGYEVIVEVSISGRTWQRTINVGPESHRTTGWAQAVTPP